jgi:hypothetical protein
MTSKQLALTAWVVCLGLLAGCSGIDPTPFTRFHQGAQTLADSVQTLESTVVDETRARELAEIAADPARFPELEIQFDTPAYDWSYPTDATDPLVFTALENRAQASEHLNELFAAYAKLLEGLAGFQVTDEQLDAQAQAIEGEAGKVLDAVGKDGAQPAVNFLTNLFLEGARVYAEHKQKRKLEEIIEAQQPSVERFAKMGMSLMEDSALDLADEYQRSFQDVQRQVPTASDTAAVETLVDQAMTLNDGLTKNLAVVRNLHAVYASLPAAHAELAVGVREGRGVSRGSEITEFVNRATRLANLYEDLRAPATASTPPATQE